VKMAKEQGLSINIPKLSGVCGRLKCCLQYEKECYHDGRLYQHAPAQAVDPMTKELEQVFKEESKP
jgi:cell fate regulator YaaT (PSP1 superfamily)